MIPPIPSYEPTGHDNVIAFIVLMTELALMLVAVIAVAWLDYRKERRP